MNKQALYHRPESNYCFALKQGQVVLRLRTASEDVFQSVFAEYNTKYEFAEHRFVSEMTKKFDDGVFAYYETKLCLEDSRLAYVFGVVYNGVRYTFSEDGLTENYDYSLGYYNFFQIAYLNAADIHRIVPWSANAVFYQIFVDRFNRGNFTKNTDYVNMKWSDKPNPKSFAGGDLDGIRAKLDYLVNLGITALYLTPVFTASSNHKYDVVDYYEVDPMFGGNEALKQLIFDAHERGMKVVLDAVFNHASEQLAQFVDVKMHGEKSPYHDWFMIKGDKPTKEPLNYECFAACDYMPKFDTGNAEVQKFLCDIGVFWVEKFHIDGWRLDVADEVSHDFWKKFRKAVKIADPDALLIGENWHNSESYLKGDEFDGVMNYAFTKIMLDVFKDGSANAESAAERLNGIIVRYPYNAQLMMLNLIDSHDTHRFYSEVKLDKTKLLAALAIEIFMPGSASVYYGTEIFTEGGYDPDSRRAFDWTKPNSPEIQDYTDIMKALLRIKQREELGNSDISVKHCCGALVITRGEKISLTVNIDGKQVNISGKVLLSSGLCGSGLSRYGWAVTEN